MKIIIEEPEDGMEEEIVIRARNLDEQLMKLIHSIRVNRETLTGYHEGSIRLLEPKAIYYFEAVDNRVYAYYEKEVYEIHSRLYELEEHFQGSDFLRISKSIIVNLAKVARFNPILGSRFEAVLKNGEKIVISRQYVPKIKEKLGI